MNYVITTVSEKDFLKLGISWLSSLFDFSFYEDDIILIDFGLSDSTKKKLLNNGIIVLDNVNNCLISSLKDFVLKNKGIYAYWDLSCVFQDNINEIFKICENKILYTKKNGFFAFDSKIFNLFYSIFELCSFLEIDCDSFFEYYKESFLLEDKWNCTNIGALNDIQTKLCFNNEIQIVLNYKNQHKNLLGKNLLFWERNKDCYEFYLEKFKKIKSY